MKVMIECDCSNVVEFSVESGKVAMVRDYLQQRKFCCDIQNTKKFVVRCNQCNRWVTLSMD